jgi:hypothetical protein
MDLETHLLRWETKLSLFHNPNEHIYSDSSFTHAKFDIFPEPFVRADGRISISVERQQCAAPMTFPFFPERSPLLTPKREKNIFASRSLGRTRIILP